MGTETALNRLAFHFLRPRPALRRTQHNHRPARTCRITRFTSVLLDRLDLFDAGIHRLGHQPVHRHRIAAFDEVRLPAVALHQIFQLLVRDAGKDSRVRDLISIEMKNRKNSSIRNRIQELVAVPRRS